MFFWRDRRDLGQQSVERCFTDSLGGVSAAPFSGLNLAKHVGDDEAAVVRNRALVANQLGSGSISWLNQVHGRAVKVVSPDNVADVVAADAQVTAYPGIALAVMVADCTPVLLTDPQAGVIGAVHAGRPGMMAGVVSATLDAMHALGAEHIEAVVGPSVCGRCYEVPEAMRQEAAAIVPAAHAVTWTGTAAIDVAAGVVAQLASADVDITWVPGCTREDTNLYSYRRDGTTGRFAGFVVRTEQAG